VTLFRAVATLVIGGALALAGWNFSRSFEQETNRNIPIAEVREGEFIAAIEVRGQIQAGRSFPIYAPIAQDLRISWMAPTGDMIVESEPLIRFDSSTAQRDLIERRAARDRASATLEQAIAEEAIAAQRDRSQQRDAELGVEIARLATLNSEFISRIDAERARIDLDVAEQNLRQLEAEIAQRAVSAESRIASVRRQLDDAEAEVSVVENRIARMEIRAPLSGYPIYSTNSSSLTMALGGGNPQPFRVGDQVSGGMNLAVIPDMDSLLMDVAIEEIDRGRIREGDEVIVRVDALPDLALELEISQISPLAEMSFDTRGRNFHVMAALGDGVGTRLRPGMNGSMDIVLDRIPNAMKIPAGALFTRSGSPVVYVVEAEGYRAVEVEVLSRNTDEVAVSGVGPGMRVALVDPMTVSTVGSVREGAE